MAVVDSFVRNALVFLVNSALILARVNTDDYQRREHSLVKPYYGNENIF